MLTADTTPYATTLSGYVITALLGVIVLGGGFTIRQIISSQKDLTEAVRRLKDDIIPPIREDIAVIKSKQERDQSHRKRRRR